MQSLVDSLLMLGESLSAIDGTQEMSWLTIASNQGADSSDFLSALYNDHTGWRGLIGRLRDSKHSVATST